MYQLAACFATPNIFAALTRFYLIVFTISIFVNSAIFQICTNEHLEGTNCCEPL